MVWGSIGATAASVLAIGYVAMHYLDELAMRAMREAERVAASLKGESARPLGCYRNLRWEMRLWLKRCSPIRSGILPSSIPLR